VIQTIARRDGSWQAPVTGTVLAHKSQPTGSWYAHGKNDKLWLNRLILRRDDGEITSLVIDQHTRIEILSDQSRTT
jgi:hypothetical protein